MKPPAGNYDASSCMRALQEVTRVHVMSCRVVKGQGQRLLPVSPCFKPASHKALNSLYVRWWLSSFVSLQGVRHVWSISLIVLDVVYCHMRAVAVLGVRMLLALAIPPCGWRRANQACAKSEIPYDTTTSMAGRVSATTKEVQES